ncbi:MAG: hypothetical protein ACYDHP_06380 [Ferrimicrobium sp.]
MNKWSATRSALNVLLCVGTVLTCLGWDPTALAYWIATGSSGGHSIGVTITGGGTTPQPGSPGKSHSTQRSPIFVPYLVLHTGTSLAGECIADHVVYLSNPIKYEEELTWAEAEWNRLLYAYSRCNAISQNAPTPAFSVPNWWKTVVAKQIPSPSISAPPGYAIVNTPVYLEIHGLAVVTYSRTTPAGTVTIDARAQVYISVNHITQGPYSTLGGPWPNGTITTTLSHPGKAQLAATEVWHGTFTLDGTTGSLPPLTIEGPITTEPVTALEAIVLPLQGT